MNIETLTAVLGWSAVINYIILLIWFLMFACCHDFIYNLHGRWFNLRLESFDAIHYIAMAVFKLGVLLFNLVPGWYSRSSPDLHRNERFSCRRKP